MMGKPFSLPIATCFSYLEALGIHVTGIQAVLSACVLGRKTILPFEPNDGGYVRADARGYQFLLDFHGAGREFRSFSLQDLLSGGIDEAASRDKIVLIGVVAESVKDFLYTPLSRGFYEGQHMAGVALHGHTTGHFSDSLSANPLRSGVLVKSKKWLGRSCGGSWEAQWAL